MNDLFVFTLFLLGGGFFVGSLAAGGSSMVSCRLQLLSGESSVGWFPADGQSAGSLSAGWLSTGG